MKFNVSIVQSVALMLLRLCSSCARGTGGIDWIIEDFSEFSVGSIPRTVCHPDLGCLMDVYAKPGKPMIFNSSNPTGGDYDLGTPNINSGGPGFGIGTAGGKTNTLPRGNALIISEDGNRKIPNGEEDGGNFTFAFSRPLFLHSFGLLDNDKGLTVKIWDTNNKLLYNKAFEKLGDNAFQFVPIKVPSASKMVIQLNGSGAITDIKYAPVPEEAYFLGEIELSPAQPYDCEVSGLNFSIDGDTIIVGNFVYQKNDSSSWELVDELGEEGCFYPRSAISGDYAFVGSDFYVRDADGTWVYHDTIESDPLKKVAMSGNTLIVGTKVYVWDGTGLELETTLTLTEPDESFGYLISIDGNTILVGGTSKVYVFERENGMWSQQAVLTASAVRGAALEDFGNSFDIEGNTIVVTAKVQRNSSGLTGGILFVYERSDTSWIQLTTFTHDAPDSSTDYVFSRVAIGVDTFIVATKWYLQGWRWMYGGPVIRFQQFRHYATYGWVSLYSAFPASVSAADVNLDIGGSTLVVGHGWAPFVVKL